MTAMSADSSVPAADTRHPSYQELKGRVHQELLNRLNLDRLTRMKRQDAEPEIRTIIEPASRKGVRSLFRSVFSSARR